MCKVTYRYVFNRVLLDIKYILRVVFYIHFVFGVS
jgi:hypothetical protein